MRPTTATENRRTFGGTHASLAGSRRALAALGAVAVMLAACDNSTSPRSGSTVIETSFEQGLGAWTTHATDVTVGGDELDWSIAPTTDVANDGVTSIQLQAENRSDAAKLWIQRSLTLEPNTAYRLTLAFDFGTADHGAVNLWRIIAGALTEAPTSGDDLEPVFRDNTGTTASGTELDWLTKSYQEDVTTDASGRIVVVIGVWGTYEVTRTYFVDDVHITAEPLT